MKKNVTIESIAKTVGDLGIMMKRGFSRMATKNDLVKMATKDDLKHFATKDDLAKAIEDLAMMVKRGFDEMTKTMARKADVDRQFANVDERFDRIEKLILPEHKRRIEHLEGEMRGIKDMFAIK